MATGFYVEWAKCDICGKEDEGFVLSKTYEIETLQGRLSVSFNIFICEACISKGFSGIPYDLIQGLQGLLNSIKEK